MGKNGSGEWDKQNINIPAGDGWFGGDAYWFEVKFKTVDSHLTVQDNAYVDLFGYGIDSPNVNNATDPYYAESDDYYSYGDSYNVVHVGQTHGWGCWGGGNPGTSTSRIDRQFLGRYAYVGNYYVPIDADSEQYGSRKLRRFTKRRNCSTLRGPHLDNLTFNFKGATRRSAPFRFTSPCLKCDPLAGVAKTSALPW